MKLPSLLGVSLVGFAMGLGAGCVADAPPTRSLELEKLDSATIAGTLTTDRSTVRFESTSDDQRKVKLHLDVNGAAMDFTYDIDGTLTEEGGANLLHGEDLSALLELRDAVNFHHPKAVQGTLQGLFLSRHADWLADAPEGYEVQTRSVDVSDRLAQHARDNIKGGISANSTNDDDANTTCLRPGLVYTAFFDAGNGGTQWTWNRTANSGSCLGRCGAGCNIFDTDLMLDCFEHDTCVDHFGGSVLGGNPDCGDEFNHAVVEYTVTLGAWCPF